MENDLRRKHPRTAPGTLREMARAYLVQSTQDLSQARALLKEDNPIHSAFFSVQAGVNALTAICLAAGRPQVQGPTPAKLFQLSMEINPEQFSSLKSDCEVLEQASAIDPFRPGESQPRQISQPQDLIASAENILRVAHRSPDLPLPKTWVQRFRRWAGISKEKSQGRK